MSRLLAFLGFIAFVIGAACLGYALYLLLTVVLGWNPFGTARPFGGRDMMATSAVAGLVLVALGWVLGQVSARMGVRRRVVVVGRG